MFQVDELVVYSGEGVCKVEAIGVPKLAGGRTMKGDRIYYTLQPLYRSGKVYTPVDSGVFMRPVLGRQEAIDLIKKIPETEAEVYENRNLRFLTEHYQSVIASHDCADLVRLIKAVYLKRANAIKSGKKLGQIDERYMKRAEDMLYGELAVSLGIPRSEVSDYIAGAIDAMDSGENWNG